MFSRKVTLEHPQWWMVFALPWPATQDRMAEAAFVTAPSVIPETVPKHIHKVLQIARTYHQEDPKLRSVWFSDLTRWLGRRGQSWADLETDWERALIEIPEIGVPGLFLTVSRRAHMFLADSALEQTVVHFPGGSEVLSSQERLEVHRAFERQIMTDWPVTMKRLIAQMRD